MKTVFKNKCLIINTGTYLRKCYVMLCYVMLCYVMYARITELKNNLENICKT
jgi:hypothetical protein